MVRELPIKKGLVFWLPCKVKGGPFPNERRVYVQTGISEWFGFVSVDELERKTNEGLDRVRAVVLGVTPDHVIVGIRGQSPASGAVQAERSLIRDNAAIQA
ncbi:MAG: hypothetical protein ACREQR_13845 [Candidatus Binataceae bacterium]